MKTSKDINFEKINKLLKETNSSKYSYKNPDTY